MKKLLLMLSMVMILFITETAAAQFDESFAQFTSRVEEFEMVYKSYTILDYDNTTEKYIKRGPFQNRTIAVEFNKNGVVNDIQVNIDEDGYLLENVVYLETIEGMHFLRTTTKEGVSNAIFISEDYFSFTLDDLMYMFDESPAE